jgi:hypothetical protein
MSAGAMGEAATRRATTDLPPNRRRLQTAVVLALADQIELVARAGDADGLRDQLIEETTRLLAAQHRDDVGRRQLGLAHAREYSIERGTEHLG